jgi:tetratricopeptide (TPR) repeat protein
MSRVAIFPLVNVSGDRVVEWMGSVVPEYFSRQMRKVPEFQVWEPTFLFAADSSGWTMESDSLLKIHQNRWGWDVACGGRYLFIADTVSIELRIFTVKNGRTTKKKVQVKGLASAVRSLCVGAYPSVMSILGYQMAQTLEQLEMGQISRNGNAYATYAAGYGFEMRGDYSAAITAYRRATEIDPYFSQALCRIGKLYAAGNSIDSAKMFFKLCLDKYPNDPEVIAEIADFYTEYELPEKTVQFITINQSVLNNTAKGMKAIGKSLLVTGEFQRAIAILNRAIARGAEDLETDFVLGRAYLSSGDFIKASEVFNRLVKYQPDCMRYYALLGSAYRSCGRLMESAKILENARKMDPENIAICINLAQTYFSIGWDNNALQLLLRAREKAPEIPEICVNLGVVYWHMGKRSEADSLLSLAEKMGSSMQSVLNNQANTLFLDGDIRSAISKYRKADKVGKKNEKVLMNLANAYFALNKLKQASQFYDEVLRMSPDRLDVLTIQAQIAEKRKKQADAERFYRKIIELSPKNEEAIGRLVEFLIKQKRFKEALDPVESYLNDYPNNKQMLLRLAGLYDAMEWYEVAIMKYQTIVRDFPDAWEGYLGLGKSMYKAIKFKNAQDYDKTIYYLKIACEKNPQDPEPDYIIGTLYLDYKNYRELAIDHWKKALEKSPDKDLRKTLENCIAKAQQ